MSMFDPESEPSADAVDRAAQRHAEADEVAQRFPSDDPADWANRYGFGDEDAIFGKGM